MIAEPRRLLRAMFDAAVAAAQPERVIERFLPDKPKGRTIVVGAGKASAAMAAAFEKFWPGDCSGLVLTRYGYAVPCRKIEIAEAAHPVPDANGERTARRILQTVQGLTKDDLVVCLMSGGASALLALPAEGLSLADKQAVNKALLMSGANITEMNCVRKHLSAIKGGRLAAAAAPAKVVTLLISDVPGDDPAVIGSGPTVPDPTTYEDALAIVTRYGIAPPEAAMRRLEAGADETPKPGDPRLAGGTVRMIAAPQASLEAAAAVARQAGVTPVILGDAIEGEARHVAMVHAGIARQVARHGQPAKPPCVLLSGGETTVTVRGKGRGGRNAEFLLALAVALEAHPGIHAVAGDTDGIDGTEDNAGALLAPDSLERARAKGINARAMLENNDGYSFFAALGDLVTTGPTRTNVNDFRAVLINPRPA
ncbi:MAG: glycerate kinase [Alphaproteobacteria bacterium]|nr:glycerate kinase [Alphaproteobacteria bacterium]